MDMTEVVRFDQQVGKLKLSEAIRIGAKRGAQCKGALHIDGMSCALGAADLVVGDVFGEFSHLYDKETCHPVWGIHTTIFGTVTTLNDDCGWTREQIADWLESIGY